jgi:hypothetical protein
MPDENVSDGNGASQASTDDKSAAIAEARDLLISAGHQVLDSSQFHGIKKSAAEKAERQAAELAAQLEAERAEKAELAAYKAEIENKGKSELDLLTERQRAWEQANAEKESIIENERQRVAVLEKNLQRERVQNHIRGLLSNSVNSDAALMWAEKHIGSMLTTDDDGQLVWTDPTGIPHVGPAASNLVSEWWQAQKFLHASAVPGPQTNGSPTVTPPKPETFQRDPNKSLIENMLLAERHDRKTRR